jgi:glycosyltransferase involved in cell wall biosynthesis
MKFTVVTPCLNASALLPETLRSVESQNADMQHIIVDGGSTDGTLELLRGRSVEVISEPDHGMYDALGKGLRRAAGEWITYLNAGDTLAPMAMTVVAQAEARWVVGRTGMIDAKGRLRRARMPYRYRRSLILAAQYCRRPPLYLPFLQQEGTFWRRELLDLIDYEKLASFRVAGDQYLWTRFATVCEPTIVSEPLGLFHRHPGQLSEDRARYHAEVRTIAQPLAIRDAFRGALDQLFWLVKRAS